MSGNPWPKIATRSELARLEASRPKPQAVPSLTPDGPETVTVRQRLDGLREHRIGELRERLQGVRDGLEADHAFARMGGLAKSDFGRSR